MEAQANLIGIPQISEPSDVDLVIRARAGDKSALERLLIRYRFIARRCCHVYFMPGAEREDLLQEGMIGLLKAIRDYNFHSGANFKSFAEICVTRQVISAVKTATRQKHAALNHYQSLHQPWRDGEGDTLVERLHVRSTSDHAARECATRDAYELLRSAGTFLTPLEVKVLNLYCLGLPIPHKRGSMHVVVGGCMPGGSTAAPRAECGGNCWQRGVES